MRMEKRIGKTLAAVLAAGVFFLSSCSSGIPGPASAREWVKDLFGDPGELPVLNEVSCANFSLLRDPVTGDFEDYIELYNPAGRPVSVEGLSVSDSPKKKFGLPGIEIAPGGYLILWADGSDEVRALEATEDSPACCLLPFRLSEGESMCFYGKNGSLLEKVALPSPHKNIAVTKVDGAWTEAWGTPGAANRDDADALYVRPSLVPPSFDHESGFYEEAFDLVISSEEGGTIRYTLDGSVPGRKSTVYTEPIRIRDRSDEKNRVVSQPNTTLERDGAVTEPVPKGTVVRAAVFRDDGSYSETVNAHFYVGKAARLYEGRAVLSVIADPDDLFGEYGICVTGPSYDAWYDGDREGDAPWPQYMVYGPQTERDAEILLWNADREIVVRSACGMRLSGEWARGLALKRFTFYARKMYGGSGTFGEGLFPGASPHAFTTRDGTGDVIATELAEDLGIGGLAAYPETVAEFVNGEFYREIYLREHYDRQYFADHFGADKDDVVLISDGELDAGTEADLEEYRSFISYVLENDASDPAVYETIRSRMDVENFAYYTAYRLYVIDRDWDLNKNSKVWKSRTGGGEGALDGRWRWMLFDLDSAGWLTEWDKIDPFETPMPFSEKTYLELPLLADLLKNPEFRELFVRAWVRIADETVTPERAEPLIGRYEPGEDSKWRLAGKRQKEAPGFLMKALGLTEEELERILE